MPQLPEAIWRRRIENEYSEVSRAGRRFDVSVDHTDYVFHLSGAGLRRQGNAVVEAASHDVRLRLNREYPYAGGFELTWLSPIFHPNIDEKGRVCIQLVNKWSAGQTVASIVGALEQLLANPNPDSPLNFEAAQYYYEHPGGKAAENYRISRPRILG